MSRCELKGRNPNHIVAIGIDPPSGHYFYEVTDKTRKEGKELIVTKATSNKSLIIRIMNHYADLNSSETQRIMEDIRNDLDPGRFEPYKKSSYFFRERNCFYSEKSN